MPRQGRPRIHLTRAARETARRSTEHSEIGLPVASNSSSSSHSPLRSDVLPTTSPFLSTSTGDFQPTASIVRNKQLTMNSSVSGHSESRSTIKENRIPVAKNTESGYMLHRFMQDSEISIEDQDPPSLSSNSVGDRDNACSSGVENDTGKSKQDNSDMADHLETTNSATNLTQSHSDTTSCIITGIRQVTEFNASSTGDGYNSSSSVGNDAEMAMVASSTSDGSYIDSGSHTEDGSCNDTESSEQETTDNQSSSLDIAEDASYDIDQALPPVAGRLSITHKAQYQTVPDEDDECIQSERKRLASFLVNQMMNLQACSESDQQETLTQSCPRGCPELQGIEGHTCTRIVRPSRSKSVRASSCNIPLVLNNNNLLSPGSFNLSADIADLVYSGITTSDGSTTCESLSFKVKEETMSRRASPSTSFDIDSLLAFPTNLAFARQGLKVTFAPNRHSNIQSDLHIRVPLGHLPNLPRRVKSLPIADIPHFQLGHIRGADEYKVFLLFPYLIDKQRVTNFLLDSELTRFMDDVFLPSIVQHCPSAVLHHLPGSFEMACLNARAAAAETTTRIPVAGRAQVLLYNLPSQYLQGIWDSVLQFVSQAGNRDFLNPIIFLNAKNLKLHTISFDAVLMISNFHEYHHHLFDATYIDWHYLWIDIASEVIHDRHNSPDTSCNNSIPNALFPYDPSGIVAMEYTLLWKKCCLQKYEDSFRTMWMQDKYRSLYYQWSLMDEVNNLTMIPGRNHTARQSGLAYSQFYTTTKEIFDAAKAYPFQNPGLEGLAVDPKLNRTWEEISGPSHWNSANMRSAYLASKHRCIASLHASSDKSFGIRQEHRVSRHLLDSMHQALVQLSGTTANHTTSHSELVKSHRPYFVAPTSEIVYFLQGNLNKYCFGFEYILGLNHGKAIDWEHTRVMVMFLRFLKLSYGGTSLIRYPEIWADRYQSGRSGLQHRGLSLQSIIRTRGYGFHPSWALDWNHCQFPDSVSTQLAFSSPQLEKLYRRRWGDINSATTYFHQFSKVLSNLGKNRSNTRLRIISCQVLSCDLIEIFREDIWITTLPSLTPIDESFQHLTAPSAALCISNLKAVLSGDISSFKFVQSYNRHKFHPFERVTYLWDYDNQRPRQSWANKQWRTLFSMTCERLSEFYPNTDITECFRHSHFHRFLTHNLIFPHPVNGKFQQKTKFLNSRSQVIWFCAYSNSDGGEWNKEEWSCGCPDTGLYNHQVPQDLKYTRSNLAELIACCNDRDVRHEDLLKLQNARPIIELRVPAAGNM
ncbi:hypothetical protein HOY82DRAFT_542427 [Tuber indicum]|nr:hypothetical protein HOY82DRAFT_542427 [Tuber indicum]